MKSFVLVLFCIPLFEVALFAQSEYYVQKGFRPVVEEQYFRKSDSMLCMFDVSSRKLLVPYAQNDGHCSTERELSVIQGVLVDDFLVNDDTTGETGFSSPSIAINDKGSFVIAWIDSRYGNNAIFFQLYDSSGIAQGNNQKVNDDNAGSIWSYNQSIVMDESGNFVIAWSTYQNGNYEIYFQRYNASGITQGNIQKVNDDAGHVERLSQSIAMDNSGNFVIVWQDGRNGDSDIYSQQYNFMGIAQGKNQRVNDDTGNASQDDPTVAMDASGNFMITWIDDRNGDSYIYFQRYNPAGIKQGTNQKVVGSANHQSPSMAMASNGGFVSAWMEYHNRNYDIYFQQYNFGGIPLGNYRKVNDDTGDEHQRYPSIAMDGQGNFVIVWEDWRNGNHDIYFQHYTSSNIKLGNNQKANAVGSTANCSTRPIGMTGRGNFVITWQDSRNANAGIYFQRYSSTGIAQGNNHRVNDVVAIAQQEFPAIAMNGSNNFVIAWEDHCFLFSDGLYFQRYNSFGMAQGNNQIATQIELGRNWMGAPPSIAMDDPGNFVITWSMYEFRGDYDENSINFQRYNWFGILQGKQQADFEGFGSSIAMHGNGNFVIAGYDNDNIYFQQFDSSGVKLGNEQIVNEMATGEIQNTPAIAMDASGNFVIAWEDHRSGNYDIYFQCYDSLGVAQGNNLKANDDAGSADQYRPTIAMDDSGNFVIAWEDCRQNKHDVYFQRYNSTGVAQGNNEIVNDDAGSADQYRPSIAMDSGGNLVIVWEDYRYGIDNPDIIGQRYYPDGTKRGSNYRIVADGPFKLETYPVVVANSQQLAFCWMDNRRARGWDIFAKITTWDWEGVTSVPEQQQLPDDFCLFQNYPNPFNPSTTIEFALPKAAFVTLKVYNLLGEEVATLIAEQRSAGIHKICWNARGLASGVYLYRLEAGNFLQVKKLLLIR
jgi:hypothetical protein